ncbi:fructosamine kinase family protein [Marisediminicola sp. LYQ85]|uniref:fructosamine kinase family protein n=1 Tax=Marisediminicola sp. LYQ85 TaxID=3391062 RepID=UPI0039835323
MTDSTFVKRRPGAPDDFFAAEAAGLAWLAEAPGARVVGVVEVSRESIELDRIVETRPTAEAARRFGAALARTHASGAPAYGAAPAGYPGSLYIGRRAMPSAADASWGGFYARDRVLPFLSIARAAGSLDAEGERVVRAACDIVADGRFDDVTESPARLHGDLWSGNVLWAADGVVLIDPAAHGGHRETDLAMLALFGCPFLETIIEGYDAEAPLREGWRERVPLHQLHPLAVHAAGHGEHYGVALVSAARRVLDSAG